MKDAILYYAVKYFGDWERIYDALKNQEDINFEQVEKLKKEYEGKYITLYDSDYPSILKQLRRPPHILFYEGNIELLKTKNKIWMYGSYYNENVKKELSAQINGFKENKLIRVSGYTTYFERNLLNDYFPKNEIIIIDCGINSTMNMSKSIKNKFIEDNLIISEYPNKIISSLYSWEMSNRIKIGLSNKLYLINSTRDRITFELISEAIDDRGDVYCLAKDLDKKSHNIILISKGAYSVNRIKDLFDGK